MPARLPEPAPSPVALPWPSPSLCALCWIGLVEARHLQQRQCAPPATARQFAECKCAPSAPPAGACMHRNHLTPNALQLGQQQELPTAALSPQVCQRLDLGASLCNPMSKFTQPLSSLCTHPAGGAAAQHWRASSLPSVLLIISTLPSSSPPPGHDLKQFQRAVPNPKSGQPNPNTNSAANPNPSGGATSLPAQSRAALPAQSAATAQPAQSLAASEPVQPESTTASPTEGSSCNGGCNPTWGCPLVAFCLILRF